MTKKIAKICVIGAGVAALALLILPSITSAFVPPKVFPTGYWGKPLVVPDHSFCGLIQTFVNVIYFGITILFFVLIPFFIMYGGFLILTSMGSSEKVGEGRKMVTGAIVGAVIGLVAFFIIDAFFTFIGPNIGGDWRNPEAACNITFFKTSTPAK
ncbi:MAG: hypothetical protein A2946_03180 [Candidatus Liptonbacteria bacterium RIFCSPLOWO2_01_FULL_53_13]|uniref:Uncharacterized protein n=1 Tax=Candidatus Liptonbacteria bacterium RIFCSPLOWO2_01_FULL_53_13 TaxID=1798651 RepID=A0A1G2CH92_9BACT|nr:MAG: hypothetical protein A2946_03180 [Candidatus Liptonbacteria bacterium RIFCSPLOWO2_01_FULL_53_13]